MPEERKDKFFITIVKKDGIHSGHQCTFGEYKLFDKVAFDKIDEKKPEKHEVDVVTFASLLNDFISTMETYFNFVPMVLSFNPYIVTSIAEQKIDRDVKRNGERRHDLSDDPKVSVYECNIDSLRELRKCQEEIEASTHGVKHMPPVMIIGIISTYDYHLSQLLKHIFRIHEEIVMNSKKELSYKEIAAFSSIEEARQTIVEREVESIIRMSHQDQFKWMESNFSVHLKVGLKVWPKFIELCERRNLFTHTGGVVTAQYLLNCKDHGHKAESLKVGDKLEAEPNYFKRAVDIVFEIVVKLMYVMWCKFAPNEIEEADRKINDVVFQLILKRRYQLSIP